MYEYKTVFALMTNFGLMWDEFRGQKGCLCFNPNFMTSPRSEFKIQAKNGAKSKHKINDLIIITQLVNDCNVMYCDY